MWIASPCLLRRLHPDLECVLLQTWYQLIPPDVRGDVPGAIAVIPWGLNQLTFTILPLSAFPFVFGSPVCGDGPVLEDEAPWGDASWTLGI
jgi:hypothetical protein